MSKKDHITAEISFHEKMFFAGLAAIIALTGWLVSHYETANIWLLILSVSGLMLSGLFGIGQYRRVKRLLVELESC